MGKSNGTSTQAAPATLSVTVEPDAFVIRIPRFAPRPSASGKTLLVATTSGFTTTNAVINGRPVNLNCSMTIPVS